MAVAIGKKQITVFAILLYFYISTCDGRLVFGRPLSRRVKMGKFFGQLIQDVQTRKMLRKEMATWTAALRLVRFIEIRRQVEGGISVYWIRYRSRCGCICEGRFVRIISSGVVRKLHDFECVKKSKKPQLPEQGEDWKVIVPPTGRTERTTTGSFVVTEKGTPVTEKNEDFNGNEKCNPEPEGRENGTPDTEGEKNTTIEYKGGKDDRDSDLGNEDISPITKQMRRGTTGCTKQNEKQINSEETLFDQSEEKRGGGGDEENENIRTNTVKKDKNNRTKEDKPNKKKEDNHNGTNED
uniref:Uncharacterized protein n=1 Tax=Lygus hesperus TaxID=30085 RepID=A0A0A9X5U2_LYGHE